MATKHKKRIPLVRRMKRSLFSNRKFILIAVVVILSFILVQMTTSNNIHTTDLLATIAKAESNGNYNAYFGNADNSEIRFTAMPVRDVIAWQKDFVAQGSASSAVGRYQFIDSTLQGLIGELGIDPSTSFNEQLQDQLAVALLERRGLKDYVDSKLSPEEFAHNLSKEWAALPVAIGSDPQKSYYAGDGLNHARLSTKEIFAGIRTLRRI